MIPTRHETREGQTKQNYIDITGEYANKRNTIQEVRYSNYIKWVKTFWTYSIYISAEFMFCSFFKRFELTAFSLEINQFVYIRLQHGTYIRW